MNSSSGHRKDDARVRAARTKRDRTRRALLDAAEAAFGARGWGNTRVEDIAVAAGVSAATAYNHFPSKHALIGHVYAPLITPLIATADQDLAAGRPIVPALIDQVRALVRVCWRHRRLTAAFNSAIQDYAERVKGPADADDEFDPRTLAPVPAAIAALIEHGQRTGELRTFPPAAEISSMVVDLLLLRSLDRPHESPEVTVELLLTVLFGSLRPEMLLDHPIDDRPFRVGS